MQVLLKAAELALVRADSARRILGPGPEVDVPMIDQVEALPLATTPRGIVWPPRASPSLRQLLEICTPEVSRRTLMMAVTGYPARRAGKGAGPAMTNHLGCWLHAAKGQQEGGHVVMTPWFEHENTHAPKGIGKVAQTRFAQGIHRLAVMAWGTEEEQRLLFEQPGVYIVSHQCHKPAYFRKAHLMVETQTNNMLRQNCQANDQCTCGLEPPCMF